MVASDVIVLLNNDLLFRNILIDFGGIPKILFVIENDANPIERKTIAPIGKNNENSPPNVRRFNTVLVYLSMVHFLHVRPMIQSDISIL